MCVLTVRHLVVWLCSSQTEKRGHTRRNQDGPPPGAACENSSPAMRTHVPGLGTALPLKGN